MSADVKQQQGSQQACSIYLHNSSLQDDVSMLSHLICPRRSTLFADPSRLYLHHKRNLVSMAP